LKAGFTLKAECLRVICGAFISYYLEPSPFHPDFISQNCTNMGRSGALSRSTLIVTSVNSAALSPKTWCHSGWSPKYILIP